MMMLAEDCHIPSKETIFRKLRDSTAYHTYRNAFAESTGSPISLETEGDNEMAAPIMFGNLVIGYLVARPNRARSGNTLVGKDSVRTLLVACADRLSGLINNVLLDLHDDTPDAVALAISLIDFRSEGGLSLTEAAERSCMPAHNFMALFQHATGLSFEDYLVRRRLEQARKALCASGIANIRKTAELIGVTKPELQSMFRSYLGESPKAYRDRMRENARILRYWPARSPTYPLAIRQDSRPTRIAVRRVIRRRPKHVAPARSTQRVIRLPAAS